MTRKVSQKEWEFEVKRALKVRDAQRESMKKEKFRYYDRFIGKWMPLPYIIGLTAAVLLYVLYGPKEFFKFFLSWIVSITIITTAAYYVWKNYEKRI